MRKKRKMEVIWDEYGRCLPDANALSEAKRCINENGTFHVANRVSIDAMRVALKEMPKANRPITTWEFYGDKVTMDDNLRSDDGFRNWETKIWEDLLMRLVVKPDTISVKGL